MLASSMADEESFIALNAYERMLAEDRLGMARRQGGEMNRSLSRRNMSNFLRHRVSGGRQFGELFLGEVFSTSVRHQPGMFAQAARSEKWAG